MRSGTGSCEKSVSKLYDSCVYRIGKLFVLLYVDDFILMAPDESSLQWMMRKLSHRLDMKDLGNLGNFLGGVKFSRDEGGAWLSQWHYVLEIIKRFGMADCKDVNTPASVSVTQSRTPKRLTLETIKS